MKTIFLSLFVLLFAITANAQFPGSKFLPAYYYDINGQKVEGLIRSGTGKDPVKGEGFITFKEDEKAEKQNLSASMIHGFVIGTDSFTVAHAPKEGPWSRNELDFVLVMVNSPLKLYAVNADGGGGGGGLRPGISTGFGIGGGMGGFGGLGLSLGTGALRGGGGGGITYYYGSDTSAMTELTKKNFIDIMSEVMADQPDAVAKIKSKEYKIGDMEKLVTYYNSLRSDQGK